MPRLFLLLQDVFSPLQAFAKDAGGTKVSRSSDAADLPAASEAYVKRIKARLEAVDGQCGSVVMQHSTSYVSLGVRSLLSLHSLVFSSHTS